ncbi:MAG: Ig-like domain-containing protein [Bacilli bacterium]|jgi:hypothetical protein
MKKQRYLQLLTLLFIVSSCTPADTSSSSSSGDGELPIWDGNHITYTAQHISKFGSATPSGVANYDDTNDSVVIWNTDASLDNYGGVQTPMLSLNFAKAVIFEMDVISCYSQYVIKLSVEGVNETFYVLADEGDTGLISVNVVDSMLSEKFEARRTSPDPGYKDGWIYDGETKKCSIHILAKGPDGEQQTAELVLGHLSVYNDIAAVTGVDIQAPGLSGDLISQLKGSQSVSLSGSVLPETTEDQTILWESENAEIASIDTSGLLSFVDVGQTTVIGKSKIDQSKYRKITVSVLSGFENPQNLKTELSTLTYGGSALHADRFEDLFATTWGTNIQQATSAEAMTSVDEHVYDSTRVFENYFDNNVGAHVAEAQNHNSGGVASFNLYLTGVSAATIYRLKGGKLYQESYVSSAKVAYANYDTVWNYLARYEEKTIVVASSGSAYKYRLDIIPSALVANYYPSDFLSAAEWTVPDRSKTAEDSVAHALSPASLRISGGLIYLKQNKYPEYKYCFGGIISRKYEIESEQSLTMLLDVAALNQKSDYVKTMWEIKIIYYAENNLTVINSNPLKVISGNMIGFHEFTFKPAYRHFRIYLVVNGSDIGEQYPDAEMGIRSFKMYALR